MLFSNAAVTAVLAGERTRLRTGQGTLVEIALSDVALAAVSHLGRLAQAQLGGGDPARDGNYLYGAFGCDFETSDRRRIMVVALTGRQWESLVAVTGMGMYFASLQQALGHDLSTEGGRYAARDHIAAALRPWFASRTLGELRERFASAGVSWGPYQTFEQLVSEDPRCSSDNPMFDYVTVPGVGEILTAASPMRWSNATLPGPARPPELGEHTDQILVEVLGMDAHEVGRLHDAGIVA